MLICPHCGEENPERAHFCLGCGMALIPTSAGDEERKVVSILFVDLVGFTAHSDRADPEDVRARLHPYHAGVKKEIEHFGGTVEKFVGDAVMAAFGAPVAHEDDAERAVRAGLRILEAIEELNEAEPGLGLSVRAAVNTGEAVVALAARPAEGEGFVTGDVVNTAARLQQTAPVGALVVGEQTFHTTKHAIEYEELEPISVKGKGEPLPVWLARRPHSFGIDVEQQPQAPLIGREHELALLRNTYSRMLRESSVQLVTLTGEPGIGKTRLVGDFRRFVDEQPQSVLFRQGRCLPYGEGITFWALGEIVKQQAGILESDSPDQAAEKLAACVAAAVEEVSERDWFTARLAPLVGALEADGGGSAERAESFTAWRRFLEALASRKPLVVILEDLHWADPPLLEFVEHVLDWATGIPLLVVCTARPELFERNTAWGGGNRNSTTVALSPLTAEETARLVSLLSQAVLPMETQAAVLERAGGNPLYAEEFVRMLKDRGILAAGSRPIVIAADDAIAVPETVQALIAARIDTLLPDRKALLHDAAVVGKVFWAGAVASIGERDGNTVRQGLHELVQKELVRPVRTSSVQDQEEFSFWHVLIRDVAYAQIPRAARSRKHQAAAAWIEGIAADRAADHAEILVHHYAKALELARAAGTDAPELEERTKHFLVLAGERVLRLDVGKAESYFQQALELLAPGEPERARALAGVAATAALAGRYAEAEAGYAEAIADLRAQEDHRAAGEALVKLGAIVRDRGEGERARSLFAEAVELLERAPPSPELVLAYTHLARYYHFTWPPEQCFEWAEKAMATARELSLEGQGMRALVFRGFTRFELGDPGGLDDLNEALRVGLELGMGEDTAGAYLALGDIVWWTEGPAAGLDVYRSGIEFAERRGLTYYTMYLKGESVWTLFELGEWDALLEVAREIVGWDRTSYQALLALPYVAHVHLLRGQLADAAALRDDFLPRARESGDPQVLMPALVTSALIDESRGDSAAALALIEHIKEATKGRPVRRAQHLPDALRVCAATGATELAERLLEPIEVAAARQLHAVQAARAVQADMLERADVALSLYAEAAKRWAEFGFVLEHGHALLGAGRCLLSLDRAREAAAKVGEAHEVFSRLQAQPLVEEADALSAQAAAHIP